MSTKQGLDERFATAIQTHRASMFRVARAMLHAYADAEDAVSAATVSAYQHISRLRSWDAVRPWLMRITVNECHSILRRRKRETPFDANEIPRGQALAEDTPLWMIIEQLEPKYSAVLQMYYGEGMSLLEISGALHLTKGAISSRITRGRQQLKRQMEQEARQDDRKRSI